MGKVIGRVYKHIQHNWIYKSPNTAFFLPPLSDNYTPQLITDRKSTSPENQIKTKQLSYLHRTSD